MAKAKLGKTVGRLKSPWPLPLQGPWKWHNKNSTITLQKYVRALHKNQNRYGKRKMQNGGGGSVGKTVEVWRSKEREEGKRKIFSGR